MLDFTTICAQWAVIVMELIIADEKKNKLLPNNSINYFDLTDLN